jgi:hypothetical protein
MDVYIYTHIHTYTASGSGMPVYISHIYQVVQHLVTMASDDEEDFYIFFFIYAYVCIHP